MTAIELDDTKPRRRTKRVIQEEADLAEAAKRGLERKQTKRRTLGDLAAYAEVHRATIHSWLTVGTHTPSGGRLFLEGERRGGFWYSTYAALDRFFAELTRLTRGHPVSETPAAAQARARKDQERARKKLGKRS